MLQGSMDYSRSDGKTDRAILAARFMPEGLPYLLLQSV